MSKPLTQAGGLLEVCRKELVSSLRDRQTAIYTFVMPLVMYPIMFWVMIQGVLLVQGRRERTEVTVALAGPVDEELRGALERRGTDGEPALVDPLELVEPPALDQADTLDEAGARSLLASTDDAPDGVLVLGADEAGARLFYDSAESGGELARERVRRRLGRLVDDRREEAARAAGHDPRSLEPLRVTKHDIAEARDQGALMLSLILPLMLVVMVVMGAFFPAVDLTAGEKERGTAETTLLLPVRRGSVLLGKVLATSALAIVATFLNLIAIGLSAENLLATLAQGADMSIELPVLALVAITPLAALFAFFTAAVLVSFAGLARSFKEGQALLGPVQMVFILPAMIGVVPGIELNLGWALVPVVNVVLAFKALLVGKLLYLEFAVCGVALVVYALVAVRLAVHLLSRESVALAGETLPLKRLAQLLRSGGSTR